MFHDTKTVGSGNPSYSPIGGPTRGRRAQEEPPYHLFDFVGSFTRSVKGFAYIVIDALKGRYDR